MIEEYPSNFFLQLRFDRKVVCILSIYARSSLKTFCNIVLLHIYTGTLGSVVERVEPNFRIYTEKEHCVAPNPQYAQRGSMRGVRIMSKSDMFV